jgi:putative membrane protein
MKILIHWFLSAVAVWLVSEIVPGFKVDSLGSALIAAVVIGLVNATLGLLFKIVTFPLTVMTLGLVWLIINAVMLLVAAQIVPGFAISGFLAAFFGAIVLSLVNMVLRALFLSKEG